MKVDVVTIFPDYLRPLELALVGRACRAGLIELGVHDLRDWTTDAHRSVDDAPFGGGGGMVMTPQPWWAVLEALGAVGAEDPSGRPPPPAPGRPRVLVPSPTGRPFTQQLALELAGEPWLLLACGRYEGIDQRVLDAFAHDVVSLGDYVLAGGEVAALVIVEAVSRLLPGVVGNPASVLDDSFSREGGLLEGPVYTRPARFRGRAVPEVLRSGDHAAVAAWRAEQACRRSAQRGSSPDEARPG